MLRCPCGPEVLELDPATWIVRLTRAGAVVWERPLDVGASHDGPVDPASVRALGLWRYRHRESYRVLVQAHDPRGRPRPPREGAFGAAGAVAWREGADPAIVARNRHLWLGPAAARMTVWAEQPDAFEMSELGGPRPDLAALGFREEYVDDDIPGGPDLSGFSYQGTIAKRACAGPFRELATWNGWLLRVAERIPGHALLVLARKTALELGWACGEDGDAIHSGYRWVDEREVTPIGSHPR